MQSETKNTKLAISFFAWSDVRLMPNSFLYNAIKLCSCDSVGSTRRVSHILAKLTEGINFYKLSCILAV